MSQDLDKEYEDLKYKISKLEHEIYSIYFADVPKKEQINIIQQSAHMKAYQIILRDRLYYSDKTIIEQRIAREPTTSQQELEQRLKKILIYIWKHPSLTTMYARVQDNITQIESIMKQITQESHHE